MVGIPALPCAFASGAMAAKAATDVEKRIIEDGRKQNGII